MTELLAEQINFSGTVLPIRWAMDKLTLLLKKVILYFDNVLPKELLLFARTSEFSELKYT